MGQLGRANQIAEQDRHRAAVGRALRRRGAGGAERLVLPDDRLLQRAQLLARLEAELLRQDLTRRLECGHRVCLTSCAIERAHQLRPEAASQRMVLVAGGWWPSAECRRPMVVVPEPAVKGFGSFVA